jgi:hypothetical protein
VRGHHGGVGGGVEEAQAPLGLGAQEVHAPVQTERGEAPAQGRAVRALARVPLAAHDQQARRLGHHRHRLQQRVEALDRLQPADVQEHRIRRQLQQILGLGRVHRLEEIGVDPARDHRDALGAGAVVPHQVRPLHHVGRHHPVGLGHDPRLLVQAQGGLELRVALGHRVLQAAQGVEHLHEWGAPRLAQPQAGHAGEPVVRVDQIVGQALIERELLHPGRELLEVRVHRLAGHRGLGPRWQVHHPRARTQLDHPRDGGVLGAGEDVDVHAHPPELARDLPHVHVHAARLLAPERGQGAGVDR